MFGRDTSRRHNRRHRLDALALARHQQPNAIILEWSRSILPAKKINAKEIDILRKTRFTRLRLMPHLRPRDIQPNQQDSKSEGTTKICENVT